MIDDRITRRRMLLATPVMAAASRAFAQPAKPPIAARKLSQMTLLVSDVRRSLDFYQGLFGMPVQARQGSTVFLRVGAGPQYLALKPAGADAKPGFSHFGLAVDGFDAGRIMKALSDRGVVKSDDPGPMKARLTNRGGTAELLVGDPDGLIVQLQDASYCGGSGALGNVCSTIEPAPRKGSLALRDVSHFTIFTPNAERSQAFYRDLFGVHVQAHQGPAAPVFGVGAGPQFLMLAGGGGRGGAASAAINHGCFLMDGFDPDDVLKKLTDYGLKPRGATGAAGPLMHYISLRMENRGGAPGGTPELYFTDPDGILLQLQDTTYCGGGGKLGEVCNG
jgi:catechol 2,3-dioxygenase-like lactoylglutathione lyase family enzyme